ncbi:Cell wall / vacuolar inhibitor of fructosidase 2 [Linum grandiflorum]
MDSNPSLLPLLLLLLLLLSTTAAAPSARPDAAKAICKLTSDYNLCIDVLYSDPRTPGADLPTMADVVARLGYQNATDMRRYLYRIRGTGGGRIGRRRAAICGSDYRLAESKMEKAVEDLNSETYYEFVDYAAKASRAARHCQAVFSKSTWQPLGDRTRVFMILCEAVDVIGKSFTGGGGVTGS